MIDEDIDHGQFTFGTCKVFKNLIGLFEIANTSKASPLPFEDWQP
jgi:hypothetical protein